MNTTAKTFNVADETLIRFEKWCAAHDKDPNLALATAINFYLNQQYGGPG